MSGFADYFSGHADAYAAHRPTYPRALLQYLDGIAPTGRYAWDVATGSGQAATALANTGRRVLATDASARQVGRATPHPGVRYVVALAESPPLPDRSVGLVTVAQALHWFDVDRFFRQVHRVLIKDGVAAVWAYGLFRTTPTIDTLIVQFHDDTVGRYWPRERGHIEAMYRDLPFPFRRLDTPGFVMEADWSLERVLGYLSTWSAVRRYVADKGSDPLTRLGADLREAWGDAETRRVSWPLLVRVGRHTQLPHDDSRAGYS